MRILVVEDNPNYVDWFTRTFVGHHLDVVNRPWTAQYLLGGLEYTVLCLDHDLGCEPHVGRDVSAWLLANPDQQRNLRIVVHSQNSVSGPKIERELAAADRDVTWHAFDASPELALLIRDGRIIRAHN